MAAKSKVFKEDILKASVEVLKKNGENFLTTRHIAKELNISTQPIYSHFKNIENLKNELINYINTNYLKTKAITYKDYALFFLNFAKTEKALFMFIYVRNRKNNIIDDINYDDIINSLSLSLEISIDKAKQMHKKMQYYCYSLGVMIASNYLELNENQISQELSEIFKILLKYYKNITNEDEFKYWLKKSHNLL